MREAAESSVVVMSDSVDTANPQRRLAELKAAHRALDNQIDQLVRDGFGDQLQLQRLKKQKLALRDRITRLEDEILPDIIA